MNGSIYGLPTHVSSIACQVNPGSSQEFAYDPYEVLDCAETGGAVFKTTGVKSSQAGVGLQIFPNPAWDEINLLLQGEFEDNAPATIVLSDIQGKTVATLYNGNAAFLRAQKTFRLPLLSAGVYFLKLRVNGILQPVQKLIIQ